MAKMMPAVFFRKLVHGLCEQRTSFLRFAQKQRGHAAIEEDGNAWRLFLPEACGLLCPASMPGKGSFFISPCRLPIRGRSRCVAIQQLRSRIELPRDAQNTGSEHD